MPDRHLVDVHVLLTRDTELLLTKRRGGAFEGMWHLPSGKLDAGEDVLTAAAREAEEEVGVEIDPSHLSHVHTVHANGSGPEPRIGLFFTTSRWNGEPSNRDRRSAPGSAGSTCTGSLMTSLSTRRPGSPGTATASRSQ